MSRRKKIGITGEGWVPLSRALPEEDAAEYLTRIYRFDDSAELRECLYDVQCRITRDMASWLRSPIYKYKRDAARNTIREMMATAGLLLDNIAHLRHLVSSFQGEAEYNPQLMEDIFHVNMDPPSSIHLPSSIDQIPRLFSSPGPWEEVSERLMGILSLPIRSRTPDGPIANRVLKKCVAAGQGFWRSLRRGCSMEALDLGVVILANDPAQLTGDCERFIHDLLKVADASFTLKELKTAWRPIYPRKRT
jgi:hypothetical protein